MPKRKLINREQNFTSTILSCIGDGIISTDLSGRVIYMNKVAEKITGWKANEAYGENFEKILPIFDAATKEKLENPISRVLKSNTAVGLINNSITITRKGSRKYISATSSLVRDSNGGAKGVVVVFRDITKLKTLEIEHISEKDNLNTIFNYAPVGMMTLDEKARILQINDAALLMIDKAKEFVIGMTFGDSFECLGNLQDERGCGYGQKCQHCELRKGISIAFEQGQAISNVEFKNILLKNGKKSERWFRASITPIAVDGKRHIVVTLIDITEAKHKELDIVRSRDFCMNILNQIPALIWRADEALCIDYVNHSWIDFTGVSAKQFMDYGWTNVIHPEDLDSFVRQNIEAAHERAHFEMELRIRHFDGEYRWCMNVGNPYYDLDGRFAGYIGAVYDITERKEAEETLKRYKILLENANDIILFIDMDGGIIEANKAAVKAYGYTYEELLSMNIHSIREDWGYTREQMQEANDKGLLFEAVHRRKDHSFFPVEVSSKGITTGGKRILLSIVRDITHAKEAEKNLTRAKEEAEAANRAKGEFLANMSHEIRTPLNGILGMLELTLLTDLDEEQKDNLITAKNCANALLGIINDILDFSKMEAGKLAFENSSFNIKELVEELVKMHVPRVVEKGLELNYTFSSTIPQFLIGDPNRLRQILNNLISNAIKFTESGHIDMAVKKTAATNNEIELMFSVSDTGIGIASEDISKLFKSFSQIDGSFTKRFGGTGLGLVISKQLVEIMGGKIWVESEKGKGSIFYFTLKFKRGTYMLEKNKPLSQTLKTIKSMSILLVEDDAINQKIMMKILKEKGHRVEAASNGKEALILFEPGKYDVILMDIQMPEMDGIEATKRILEKEKLDPHTPIIAMTAYALQGDREKFLALGMDEYVPKPVQINELFSTIDKVTSGYEMSEASMPDKVVLLDNGEVRFTNSNPEKIYAEIISKLSEMSEAIKEMETAIKSNDLMNIEDIAHHMKALSNKIDASEIKDVSFKIELAARRGNLADAAKYIKQISNEFKIFKESIGRQKEVEK